MSYGIDLMMFQLKSSLKVLGNNSNKVLFTSDRLDEYYRDIPGQWGRIWLTANSSDNLIQDAIIKMVPLAYM